MSALTARRHTIASLLRRTAQRDPAKTAIICGDVTWRYAELDALCDRIGAALIDHGVGIGDKIALLARNSHAFMAMRFAIARIGAVLVPVNNMLKAEEIAYVLRHSGARIVCTDTQLAATARAAAVLKTQVERFIWLPSEHPTDPVEGMISFDDLSAFGGHFDEPLVPGDALAQIVYTSGTESLPKGAMLSHDGVIAQYTSCIIAGEYKAADTMLHAMPLFHCAQLDTFFGPCVYTGVTNIITGTPTPEVILKILGENGVTSFFAPPTIWISLLRSPLFAATDLSKLKKCYYGASIMPVAVLREMQERLPGVRFWNFYGQTEIAPTATVLGPDDQIRKAGSAGRAVLNVETRVVDDEGNDVPVGAIGEIVHRSPQLMLGYYNDPVKTAEAFAGGWFHSGDLGVFDDEGYLSVVDRKKDMIKTGGENVASREVEEMIFKLAEVSEVAVVGLPDPLWVEAVTAIIVVREGMTLDAATVIAHCKAHMGGFKVPKRIIFADHLPRNPTGKILKRSLRELYQDAGQ